MWRVRPNPASSESFHAESGPPGARPLSYRLPDSLPDWTFPSCQLERFSPLHPREVSLLRIGLSQACNGWYLFVYLGLLSQPSWPRRPFQGFVIIDLCDKVIEALVGVPLLYNAECSVGQRIRLSSPSATRRGKHRGALQFSLYGKEKFAATAPGMYGEFLLPGRRKCSFLSKRCTCTRNVLLRYPSKGANVNPVNRSGFGKTVSSS